MDDDEDDLDVIEVEPEVRASPRMPTRAPRVPRRTVGLVFAAAVLLATGTLTAVVLRNGSRHVPTADTVVLPPVGRPSPSTTSDPLASSRDAEFIGQMGAISPRAAWAVNEFALYETVDEGVRWRTITPPGMVDPIGHIAALDFLDSDHAWIATPQSSRPFTIWRTADAGASWQPMLPNVCGASAPCGSPVSIDFIDPQHGWALFAVPRSRSTLIATSNGGTTWSIVSRVPFAGTLHFVDQQTAWAASDPGGDVNRTADGGKSWNLVTLPSGSAIGSLSLAIGTPQFIDRNDAVVARLVLRPANVRTIEVYATRDGGATWATQPAPSAIQVRFTELASYRFAASSPTAWTLLLGTHLYVTVDAGVHWSTVMPTRTRLMEVASADAASIWALACVDTSPDGCQNQILFHTVDTGATWRVASPYIGITADRLP